MQITVVGSGAWGTALALSLCDNGHETTLWSHNPAKAAEMAVSRQNPVFPDRILPDALQISSDPSCVAEQDLVVIASPSFAIRGVCRTIAPYLTAETVLVSVTKGIEPDTLLRMSQIVEAETGRPAVALTGPSHAEEVAKGIPTACLAASPDRAAAELVQDAFMSDTFRIYTGPDIVGAELGGAVKNVIALCAGFVDGMGYGDNTKAMLITRGLSEMARLGISMGAHRDTFAGLAGIGDLTVTCNSRHSRNWRAGMLIGSGRTPEEAIREAGGVVEGYFAARSIRALALRQQVEMPIVMAAYAVLYEAAPTDEIIAMLMQRRRKAESENVGW